LENSDSALLHLSLYLVQSHGGKPRQVFVPKEWEEHIRQSVHGYQQIQQLLEELSEIEWQRLLDRKDERRDLYQDASGLFTIAPPRQGKYRSRRCLWWDLSDLTS
jgi:hypothetical protein